MEIVTYALFFGLLGYWVFTTYNLWRDREQLRRERDQAIAAFVETDARLKEMAALAARAEQVARDALNAAREHDDILQDALGLARAAETILAEQDQARQEVIARRPGRPTLTPEERARRAEKVKQVLELAERERIKIQQACARLGVLYSNFKEWRKYMDEKR